MQVFDVRGMPQILGRSFGKGGEAEIYLLEAKSDVLVKIYHPDVMLKRGGFLKNKVENMIKIKEKFSKKNEIIWPAINIYDRSKNWIGYAMKKADGKEMALLAHSIAYKNHFPNLDRKNLLSYLISLLESIEILHKENIYIGDYNLKNIMCNPNNIGQVSLIDCDSYQVKSSDSGEIFLCPVGSPDMTPPEHQNKDFLSVRRTPQSEYFSIAIILFKCLMMGRHPYDSVDGGDPVKNIVQGKFPYGKGNEGIPKGSWYNIWSHMSYRIKNSFIQTFTEGANNPDKRVSLLAWKEELILYKKEIEKGWHDVNIRPASPKIAARRGQNLPSNIIS
jgi:DNA-binding helix-hairpin-helix protein with protein kinase domain